MQLCRTFMALRIADGCSIVRRGFLSFSRMKNDCLTLAVIGVGDTDDLLINRKRPISAGVENL